MYLRNPETLPLAGPPLGQPKQYVAPITNGGLFIRESDAPKVLTIVSGPSPYQTYIQSILAQGPRLPQKFLRIVTSIDAIPSHLRGRFGSGNNLTVRGTIDRATGTIYMLPPPGRTSDTRLEFALHEAVHLLAHPFMSLVDENTFQTRYGRACIRDTSVGTFQRRFCNGLGEGLTQLITQEIMKQQFISLTSSERPYKDFVPIVIKLMSIFPPEALFRAYFLGEVNELTRRMEFRWGNGWQNVANLAEPQPAVALTEIDKLEEAFKKSLRDYPDPSRYRGYASTAQVNRPSLAGFLGNFGQPKPACPPFKFVCDPDCPFPAFLCPTQQQLCDRILGAIALAERAAAKLENLSLNPDAPTKFKQIFGQDPLDLWEVPGMPSKKKAAGLSVAERLRTVARELKDRDTLYRCVSAARCQQPIGAGGGRQEIDTGHPTNTIVKDAAAIALLCRNEVWLCPPFWQMKKEWQESTLLHEMLHLSFGLTCTWFQHDQKERKRNGASCYEAFALIADGKVPEPIAIQNCKNLPL